MAEAQVISLLGACLDADSRVRQQGEAGLASYALQPGYGLALAQVAISAELPGGTKQLAAVVLKKFVKAGARSEPRLRSSSLRPARSTGRWARSTSRRRWWARRRRPPSGRCCLAA